MPADYPQFTVVYPGKTTVLGRQVDEAAAVSFAESESGLLHTTVSLWYGRHFVASWVDGVETDLTEEQFLAAQRQVA